MKRTGKFAYVNGIPCTQGWSTNLAASVTRYQASCVPGASGATPGNTNQTGSVKGLGYAPPMPTGENFEFIGVASNKPGELLNYFGDILFTDVSIKIPVAGGTPISWSANWGAQGELEEDRTNAYEDPTRVAAPSGKYGAVKIEDELGSNTFTAVDRVQDITLTFRRPAATTIEDGTTERDGGNLECDLNFMVHNDDLLNEQYLVNQTNRVRVYVTPSLYFQIDSFIWQQHSNYNVDRSSNPPPIIGYTVNGLWTALRSDQSYLGRILLPDTTEFYPGDTST